MIAYLILCFFYYEYKISCDSWLNGLDKIQIENNITKYNCEVTKPFICRVNFYSDVLDFSHNKQCKEIKFLETEFMYINYLKEFKNFNKLYFPLTNNNNFKFSKFENSADFAEKVYENIKISEDSNSNIDGEVFIEKQKKNAKLQIDLKFNEKLSIERNSLIDKETINKNILFIYIDSLSRPHFFRKFYLVKKFLEKFVSNKNNTYESFQFMKYQTLTSEKLKRGKRNTIQSIFYPNKNNTNLHLISDLKKNGYITAQSINICSKEFSLNSNENYFYSNTIFDEYDHENVAMFCDPFYYSLFDDKEVYTKGNYSAFKRCLYGKNTFEYVLEYGKQFWTKYKNNKKFLRLGFIDGNEISGEVIKYLDEYLYEFLNYLMDTNLLKDTIVFFVSGKGNENLELLEQIDNDYFFKEKYLGAFFILIDKEKLKLEEINNLKNNQQNFVTAYDIYYSINDVIYGDKNKEKYSDKGQSIFSAIEPKERKCKKELYYTACKCYA